MKQTARVFLLAWLMGAAGAAEAPQVSLSVTPKLARIGDRIEIRVIVKATEVFDQIKVSFNAEKEKAEIVGESTFSVKSLPQYNLYEQVITVVFFQTGTFSLGPFSLTFFRNKAAAGSVTQEAQTVTIQSVLKKEDTDIAPLKPLQEMRGNPLFLLRYVAILAGLLALYLAIRFYLKRKKVRRQEVVPAPDPEDELEKSLQALWAEKWLQKGEYRQFFIRLTEIWKRFIQRYYCFPAEDFTTCETLIALQSREQEGGLIENMRLLLETADGVKFAKMMPGNTAVASLLFQVEEMVKAYIGRRKAAVEAEHVASGQ